MCKKTVIDSVEKADNEMPDKFHINELVNVVRKIINRQYLTDGCITRRLRQLRNDNIILYQYKHNKYKYYKKKIEKQLKLF